MVMVTAEVMATMMLVVKDGGGSGGCGGGSYDLDSILQSRSCKDKNDPMWDRDLDSLVADNDGLGALMSMGRVFKTRLRSRGVKLSGNIDIEFKIVNEYSVRVNKVQEYPGSNVPLAGVPSKKTRAVMYPLQVSPPRRPGQFFGKEEEGVYDDTEEHRMAVGVAAVVVVRGVGDDGDMMMMVT
ncbi:hypothetical protein Tco_0770402 [Tanacetum coccineum]|uniref:Uncharacterized protein n=1 Tax=Tanacetum coccineum TaxID=301880 RepID=A0ABQ4ZES9_9ASTR